MPFNYKKEYKEFYMPKNKPEIVNVPSANYIAVRGVGNPNVEGGAYQRAIGVLYAVAYTLKMSYKTDYKIEGFFEYVVPPLEGFWWQPGTDGWDYSNKDANIYFFFGKESTGIPPKILKTYLDNCMRMPMTNNVRSLNLSNSVAIVAYEVMKQIGFDGLKETSEYLL